MLRRSAFATLLLMALGEVALGQPAYFEKYCLGCHNYRFKKNVLAMIEHLRKFNPGRLLRVDLDFQSPPAANDGAAWLRKERVARTLLLDYSLHFLDLACMFGVGEGRLQEIRQDRDAQGHTSLIDGRATFDNCAVNFLLRQGFFPRRARLVFTFQNYSVTLGFFPDTFVPHMASDNYWLHKQESRSSFRATVRKVVDRLLARDSDESHAWMYRVAAEPNTGGVAAQELARFYRLLFAIARQVYGD